MNNKPKHILFLPRWYPHQFDSMFGLFVKKHAEAASLYNKVSVIYIQGISFQEKFDKKQVFESPNISTYIYYYNNSSNKLWNTIRYCYYLYTGFISIKRNTGKPNVVHVHILTRLGLFALFLKIIYNIPYIITEHWSRYLPIPGTYKGWLRKKLGQIIVKRANAILPISQNLAEAMQKHRLINSNYQIIPNVVDDIFFRNIDNKETNQRTIFMHVSTFEDRSKNISGILRTIQRLAKRNDKFEFWFIGDGVDFESLSKYSEQPKIPKEQIQFYGIQKGKDLVDFYYKADYMVLFSNFENIPVVINESLACGLPVIATNVGGISEMINSTNGFLIEPGNEDQLLSTMDDILSKKPLFNIKEIQAEARIRYSYKAVGRELNSIYWFAK